MKILLATDGSKDSEWAAGFLVHLHLSSSDTITVFHAIDWIPLRYDKDFYYDTLKEMKNNIAPKIFNPALRILSPVQAVISVAIDDGPPQQRILDTANNLGVDMLVMGARGRKGVESFLFGSVSKFVTTNSTKPIIVVRRPPDLISGSMKILFATDGSKHSLATGEFLSSIPFADDAVMTILKVRGINERDMESETIVNEAASRLSHRFKNINVLLKAGEPSIEIMNAAEETGADLIAVGCMSLKENKKKLGIVSRYLLENSKFSILIGKTCG